MRHMCLRRDEEVKEDTHSLPSTGVGSYLRIKNWPVWKILFWNLLFYFINFNIQSKNYCRWINPGITTGSPCNNKMLEKLWHILIEGIVISILIIFNWCLTFLYMSEQHATLIFIPTWKTANKYGCITITTNTLHRVMKAA